MQLKILCCQNCCYLPLDFLKEWPSKLNIYSYQSFSLGFFSQNKNKTFDWWLQGYLLSILVLREDINALLMEYQIGLTLQQHIQNVTKCMQEVFCESNEHKQLKEVIYFVYKTSITDFWQDSKDATGLQKFSIHVTLHQGCWILLFTDWACMIEKVLKF